ncbi:HepT-like ribonuclease domain-containing protein [Microbulbifer sp. TB1203]|uniref:HepT-like ribonuclease domain-containing protein n=1 Tax=unclassified Microbulbifer TaxID=2619833 RepID=UPI0035AE52CE
MFTMRNNLLIHGYADIDDRLVWNIVETKLPTLKHQQPTSRRINARRISRHTHHETGGAGHLRPGKCPGPLGFPRDHRPG